jgi:SAM-dependent methyltransferase
MENNHSEMILPSEPLFTISESRGLSYLEERDLHVFAPGISTAGAVEIEMARRSSERVIVGTTIDPRGFDKTESLIKGLSLENQILVKFEDLREGCAYEDSSFDYIYSRLVLHYLSSQELDFALREFYRILKPSGKLFVVVRSKKNIPKGVEVKFDEETKLTTIPHSNGSNEIRYFHTPKSISEHIKKAKFVIKEVEEYREQLFVDFERKELSPTIRDHLIEVCAIKEDKKF